MVVCFDWMVVGVGLIGMRLLVCLSCLKYVMLGVMLFVDLLLFSVVVMMLVNVVLVLVGLLFSVILFL